jgi:hypothetical protein
MQCPNYKLMFVIVAVITRHNVPSQHQLSAWHNLRSGKSVRSNLRRRPSPSRKRAVYKNQLIFRAIGRQLLADGQRLGLESSERVGAAVGSRIHCENHALAAMGSRSVCSLATMNPDGIRLVRNRSEMTVSVWI